MSMLSSALSRLGISTQVQRGFMGAAAGAIPGGSAFMGLFGGGGSQPRPTPSGFSVGGGSVGFGDFHVNLPGITLGGPNGLTGGGVGANGACPKGWHLNKHPLAATKHHGAVPAHSMCVRNRHMNPMNGRAVARAARRIHRGEKLLRKIFTVEGHKHGKIHPRAHRKRS